jgi:hypothetical protein
MTGVAPRYAIVQLPVNITPRTPAKPQPSPHRSSPIPRIPSPRRLRPSRMSKHPLVEPQPNIVPPILNPGPSNNKSTNIPHRPRPKPSPNTHIRNSPESRSPPRPRRSRHTHPVPRNFRGNRVYPCYISQLEIPGYGMYWLGACCTGWGFGWEEGYDE